MDDKTTRTPATPCPSCGKILDMATNITDHSTDSSPGDFSVCVFCGQLGRFNAEMNFVAVSIYEVPNYLLPVILKAQMLIRKRNAGGK